MRSWPPAAANESLNLAPSRFTILTDKDKHGSAIAIRLPSTHHGGNVSSRSFPRFPRVLRRPAVGFCGSRPQTDDQTASGRLRLTAAAWRALPDVTIRAQETSPGFFVASYHPTSPETHPARQGFSIDTKRGLRGKSLAKVFDFAEAYWRQNYPDT
jgi:hypothetical protein